MSKGIKIVALVTVASLACVLVTNLQFITNIDGGVYSFNSFAAGNGCNHVGYHYVANQATPTKDGNKEFWTCCKCHEQFLSTPEYGSWTTRPFSEADFDRIYDPNGIYLRARAKVTRNFDFNVSEVFTGSTKFTDSTNQYVYSETGYGSTLSVSNNDYHYQLNNVSVKVGNTTLPSAYDSATVNVTLTKAQIADNITLNAQLADRAVNVGFKQGKRINADKVIVDCSTEGMCVSSIGVPLEIGKTYYLKNMLISPSGHDGYCGFAVADSPNATSFINVHYGQTFITYQEILGGTGYDGKCFLEKKLDSNNNVIAVNVTTQSTFKGNLYLYFIFVNTNPSVHQPGVYTANSYDTNYAKLTLNCENCSVDYDHNYVCKGNIFETKVKVPSDATFESVSATVGGVAKTVHYDASTGKLYIEGAITGDVVLNVKAKLNAFDVTHSTTAHLDFAGDSTALPGSTYTAKIEPKNYKFKAINVVVKMGGAIVPNAYNEANHTVTVNNVSGNINISYSEGDSARQVSYQLNKRISGFNLVDCTSPAGMCVSEGILLEKGKTYEFVNMDIVKDGSVHFGYTGFAIQTSKSATTFIAKHTGSSITGQMGAGDTQVKYTAAFKNDTIVTAIYIDPSSAFKGNIYIYFIFNNTNPGTNKPAIYIY